jgi:hypothetical protein
MHLLFTSLYTFLHSALPAFAEKNKVFYGTFKQSIVTIIASPAFNIRIIFVVIHNACVKTFEFICFGHFHSPATRVYLFIIANLLGFR